MVIVSACLGVRPTRPPRPVGLFRVWGTARWVDTYSGRTIGEADTESGEAVELLVPAFSKDVALRLERQD